MRPARARYAGYRFPCEIIGHAVWLYFRFPLGLRMVEELLAARGIIVSHETVRQWAVGLQKLAGGRIPEAPLNAAWTTTARIRPDRTAMAASGYPCG
jgi:transposase-like protein